MSVSLLQLNFPFHIKDNRLQFSTELLHFFPVFILIVCSQQSKIHILVLSKMVCVRERENCVDLCLVNHYFMYIVFHARYSNLFLVSKSVVRINTENQIISHKGR